ncbi:HIR complex subunit [Homalodisca vitripennis]|nr:HIR complex subunit [Homalodisca vitripennis]
MRPTSLRFQQFHKLPKTTYQVLLGIFTTLVQTTKDGIPLPCYRRTIKEQVFGSFILLITHSTERILLKDADSVKVLPQNINWGVTLKGLSAEEMYNKFQNVFIGWMNIYLPMRNSRTNNFKNYHKPKGLHNWFTPQLAKMKEMVMSLFNISQATEDPRDAKNYKLAKINYKGALKQAKFHANQEFIQSSSNTCKGAWQIIKHETQPKQQQHATPDADSFNEYFISVMDEIREKIPAENTKPDELLEVQHLPSHQPLAWQPIEYSDIVKVILK